MNASDIFNKGFLDSPTANLTSIKLGKSILPNNDTPAKGTLTKQKLSDEFDGSPCAKKKKIPMNLKSNVQGVVLNERSYYYTFLGLRGSY